MEEIAEFIDEEIHKLEYKLDHTRRLLQGAETGGVMNDRNWIGQKLVCLYSMIPLNMQTSVFSNFDRC